MDDGEFREKLLEVLYEFNKKIAATNIHISQIQKILQKKIGEKIDKEQLIRCGIFLFDEKLITIYGDEKIKGWVEAIISHDGIKYIETKKDDTGEDVA